MTSPSWPRDIPEAPIHRRLGITVTHAAPDEVLGTLPVEGNTQPFGLLHGGASALLAESLASIGAALAAGPHHEVLGIENARITGARAELRTDVISASPSAKPYSAGERLYGLVNDELLWTFDMAAVGEPMTNHLSARLRLAE